MATYGSVYSLRHTAASPTVPTLITEGQSIEDFQAITLIVAAVSGQTISNTTGTLQCYVWDIDANAPQFWTRFPGLDVTVNLSSVRGVGFSAFEAIGPRAARFCWVPNSVTVSGGTYLDLYQLGHVKGGIY